MKSISIFLFSLFLTSSAFANTPAESCRQSLMRYSSVPVSMFRTCQYVNNWHAANAIDVYTQIYNRSMGALLFDLLASIYTPAQSECAISLARTYNGHMGVDFLRNACF